MLRSVFPCSVSRLLLRQILNRVRRVKRQVRGNLRSEIVFRIFLQILDQEFVSCLLPASRMNANEVMAITALYVERLKSLCRSIVFPTMRV